MGRETLARLERCQGRDLRGWALQPAPASASAPGLRLGKAVSGSGGSDTVVVWEVSLHGHGTLGAAHVIKTLGVCKSQAK